MKSLFKYYFILLIALHYSNSDADILGGDTAYLSKIYIQMKDQIKTLSDQLESLKSADQSLKKTVNFLNGIEKEAKFWNRFDINNEVDDVIQYYKDGTLIDNFALANDGYARYEIGKSIVYKRTKYVDPNGVVINEDVNEDVKKKAEGYIEDKAKAGLYEEKSKMVLTDQNITNKDLDRINTSSNAILASEALERRALRKKQEIRGKERALEHLVQEKSFMSYLKGNK